MNVNNISANAVVEGEVLPLPPHSTRAGTISLVVHFKSIPCSLGSALGIDDQEQSFAIEIITTQIPVWDITDPRATAIWMPNEGITFELFMHGVTKEEAGTIRKIRQTLTNHPMIFTESVDDGDGH